MGEEKGNFFVAFFSSFQKELFFTDQKSQFLDECFLNVH